MSAVAGWPAPAELREWLRRRLVDAGVLTNCLVPVVPGGEGQWAWQIPFDTPAGRRVVALTESGSHLMMSEGAPGKVWLNRSVRLPVLILEPDFREQFEWLLVSDQDPDLDVWNYAAERAEPRRSSDAV